MSVITDLKNKVFGTSTDKGTVFGTYNYSYAAEDFEKERGDGATCINLVPEVRVFICGADVTRDILSLSVDNKLQGNRCTINIANPRGKYEISHQDLMGNWREDKDILGTYGLKRFEHPIPDTWANGGKAWKLGRTVLGNEIIDQVQELKNFVEGIGKSSRSGACTRMIYEVKHASGYDKKIGDTVFDFRDPVVVFAKGRFSPLWYFAFTGLITGYTEADTAGSSQVITITCDDILYMLQRKKFATQGSLLPAGNLENSIMNNDSDRIKNLFESVLSEGSFSTVTKTLCYTVDYYPWVQNCSQSLGVEGVFDKKKLAKFRDAWGFDKDSKFSWTLIDSTKNKDPYYSPNNDRLSPYVPVYFQYNEIQPEEFKGENILPYYEASIRLWETNPEVDLNFSPRSKGIGWKNSKVLAVHGIHPALTYDALQHFNILTNVWLSSTAKGAEKVVDNLPVSPLDKIRCSVYGSPTEKSTSGVLGSNDNFFRPRLFVLLPKKFASTQCVTKGGFSEFKLFKEESTSSLDMLTKLCELTAYNMYCSPMGDLFFEPEMYDMHPLDMYKMYEKIDVKSPIEAKKTKDIKFRAILNESYGYNNAYHRKDKAYVMNKKANYPYFISEKDRLTITQAYKPSSFFTHLEVRGKITSLTGYGIGEGAINNLELLQGITLLSLSQQGTEKAANNNFSNGIYIADGFPNFFRNGLTNVDPNLMKAKFEHAYEQYETALRDKVVKYAEDTLTSLFNRCYNSLQNLDDSDFFTQYNVTFRKTLSSLYYNLIQQADLQELDIYSIDSDYGIKAVDIALITAMDPSKLRDDFLCSIDSSKADLARFATATDLMAATVSKFIGDMTNTSVSVQEERLTDIAYILEPVLLENDPDIQELFEILMEFHKIQVDKRIDKPVTIADLKLYEKMGFYNPRLDYARKYGYSKGPELTNMYISNGLELQTYAKTRFQGLIANAFSFSIQVIGRPEFFLNRPYYVERKDAIGLLKAYTLEYSAEGSFNSKVELDSIRKNSITYNYSLGNIDELIPATSKSKISGNKEFQDEAVKYYKSVANMKKWATRIDSVSSIIGSGSTSGQGTLGNSLNVGLGIFAEAGGSAVKNFVNEGKPEGGVYSAHDWIGHMDYDVKGILGDYEKASTDPLTTTEGLLTLYGNTLDAISTTKIIAQCKAIYSLYKNYIVPMEAELTALAKEIEMEGNVLTKLKAKLDAKKTDLQLQYETDLQETKCSSLDANKKEKISNYETLMAKLYGRGNDGKPYVTWDFSSSARSPKVFSSVRSKVEAATTSEFGKLHALLKVKSIPINSQDTKKTSLSDYLQIVDDLTIANGGDFADSVKTAEDKSTLIIYLMKKT